jgi:cyclase
VLRNRLITVLTLNDGVLFRTKEFTPDYRYTMNFVDAWSIDEIVALDVTRPGEGSREAYLEVVEDLARRCFVPLTCGGGLRTIDDVHLLFRSGADKIALNTGAVEAPELVTRAAELYGAQAVVVSIDAWRHDDGRYEVYTHFGSKPTGLHPAEWAHRAEELGAGEILITSIQKDGSLEGYDDELTKCVSSAVGVPVLAAGGAGKWQDFVNGFTKGGAAAVCTTNIYHFTESSIRSAKQYLQRAGIPVRL